VTEPAQVIEHLSTPVRLSGVTSRYNVQVPAETLTLLHDVDKKLATTGRRSPASHPQKEPVACPFVGSGHWRWRLGDLAALIPQRCGL
jgi:hypothetical protein